jgi:O-acetylhomoserine (thiol)-lyase
MKPQTQIIHTAYPQPDAYGALAMPVYHTLAYEFDNATEMADAFCGRTDAPDYSRVTNPTVIHFERIIRNLTGARDVVALTSGMAAISNAIMSVAAAGKTVITSRHLFGNTYLLLTQTLHRFGVNTVLCDLTNPAEVEAALKANPNTCCVFLEILTNPQLEVADVRALAELAHAHGAAVMADTTMIPFTHFSAKALGIDVEVVSSTKYISGGATSLGGLVIDYGTLPDFRRVMRKDLLMNLGAYMSPHAAYMQTLGLETLHTRFATQESNAQQVAEQLSAIPGVKVTYPGLKDNPYHKLCTEQYCGHSGAMISFELGSQDECFKFINALKVVKRATNLFDNRTLAIHPASTIFGPLTQQQRDEMDISDKLIRLSVGLESPADIMEDLQQAILEAQKK